MSEISDSEIIALLKENGLKATPQRLAICRLVISSKEHPTADMIFNKVKRDYPSISHATVYKTISLLKNLGLIVELNFHNSHSRFDSNVNLHVNIVCPNCNKIIDYQSELVVKFYKTLESEVGGNFIGQRFDIYKKCKECNELLKE